MVRRLYKGGRPKAFSLSYDDGVTQDERLVRLLDNYGLKATFNLNSALMEREFEWTHDCGMTVKRLSVSAARQLYGGHEVASHSLTHPYFEGMKRNDVMRELEGDKRALEDIFSRPVCGFATPFYYYSSLMRECAARAGFEYVRVSSESGSYAPERDRYAHRAGMFHLRPEMRGFIDGFFESDDELAVCQIVGHSYDLDVCDMWGRAEEVFSRVAEDDRVVTLTNLELVRYLAAMDMARISDGGIYNSSPETLWFSVDGRTAELSAGESITITE